MDFWLGFVHLLQEYDEGISERMKHTNIQFACHLSSTHKSGLSLTCFLTIFAIGETEGTTTYLQLGTFGRDAIAPIGGDKLQLPPNWGHLVVMLSPPLEGTSYNYLQSVTFGRCYRPHWRGQLPPIGDIWS